MQTELTLQGLCGGGGQRATAGASMCVVFVAHLAALDVSRGCDVCPVCLPSVACKKTNPGKPMGVMCVLRACMGFLQIETQGWYACPACVRAVCFLQGCASAHRLP